LWGRSAVNEVREKLLTCVTFEERFQIVEDFLFRIAFKPLEQNGAVGFALDKFIFAPGMYKIAAVSDKVGLSQRRCIEVFKTKVGIAPKSFCRVMRFQQAIKTISSTSEFDWIDLALDCGYFDQAHFVHDFRSFAGMTPTEYANKKGEHLNHVPL
jgi:AraC-like DNA-binding protein